jgi:hypothetical protein
VNETCTQCSVGRYENDNLCFSCTNVTTSAGSYCPAGTELIAGTAGIPCPAGSYCRGNSRNAVLCPAGSRCPAGSSVPEICPIGTYALAGSASCTTCPTGTSRAGSRSESACGVACDAGQYLNSASQCVPCTGPAGTYCPSNSTTNALPCLAGSSCAGGSNRPISCRRGTYSAAGASVCTLCPAGSSTAQAGTAFTNSVNETCTQCSVGRYENDNLCFSCTNVTTSAGSYCPAGTELIAGRAGIICETGYVCYGGSFPPMSAGCVSPARVELGQCLNGSRTVTTKYVSETGKIVIKFR